MIDFKSKKVHFKYRMVAVALHKNNVLLYKFEGGNYWALPGGKSELFENSMETLKREMFEELDIDIEINRLIWINENFYQKNSKLIHELALYYLIKLPPNSKLFNFDEPIIGHENGSKLIFKWHKINELESIRLYPEFLKKALNSIPSGIEHIIISDIQGRN